MFYCEGIWLREAAFKAIEIDQDHRIEIEKLFIKPGGINRDSSARNYPECPGTRLEVIFNDKLELDRCSSCGGIFFGKGEFTGEEVHVGENRKGETGDLAAMEGAFRALFLVFGN